ncbi:MAG: alpha/beta hydrolase family protein [Hyphomicrobiaceae bacterium]
MADPRIQHAHHFMSRFTVNGVNPSDFEDVMKTLTHWDQWCEAWSMRAKIHEDLGRAALEAGEFTSAGEHLGRAAVTYHFAKYLFVQDLKQMRAAHMKAVDCHTLALPHQRYPGERVMIPYEGHQLAAVLRKPPGIEKPPVVLMMMGLDSTKEELDTFEITFLERGMAVLAFDGPGQGEAEYDMPIRYDYEGVVGPVIDWLKAQRADLDGDRIGLWGISLGGYYAPRTVAFEKRIKAAIAVCGPYDWGALWDKLPDLTRDAFVVRSHSRTAAEAKPKADKLCLRGVASKIETPIYLVAAGLDRLTPAEDYEKLRAEIKGPCELLVIPDANHVAHNRPYLYRPQTADWMAKQLGV